MEFSTKVQITNNAWQIQVEDHILLLGSCFSTNMAEKMKEYFLQVEANPSGTLYNPISIVHHMDDAEVQKADVIIVTFGTAWVYELEGRVVDNCEKKPANLFVRRRLTVEQIVNAWCPVLDKYYNKRFIFTVSPIRHIKDGLHENQISKGILLQAVDELQKGTKARTVYFPSYEILMDELRDYRYYDEDMLHPSKTAISYIWERFRIVFMYGKSIAEKMHMLHQLWLNKNHKILKPDSQEAKAFQRQLARDEENLKKQFPWIK
ncbi:MAG: GSCFA domain-containing protein [Paludibacteraceae bacterium]|nr:GSCFA domain-containing protein [Paludibacteraceae bacterium]